MTEQNEVVTKKEKQNFFKSKTGAVTIALVGGMTIGALFFSMPDASASKKNEPVPTTAPVPEGGMPPETMMVQTTEEGTSYSEDGGETWTEGTPPGTTVTETSDGGKGMVTSSQGTPPPPGEEGGMLVKTSPDGTSMYSTDGGATWTEGLPPGAETATNPDGSQTVSMPEPGEPGVPGE